MKTVRLFIFARENEEAGLRLEYVLDGGLHSIVENVQDPRDVVNWVKNVIWKSVLKAKEENARLIIAYSISDQTFNVPPLKAALITYYWELCRWEGDSPETNDLIFELSGTQDINQALQEFQDSCLAYKEEYQIIDGFPCD